MKRRDPELSQLEYLLFLGCVIPYRVSSYEISARKVLDRLGVTLVEMSEFNCCGFPLDPINHETMLALAAQNLCLAEQQNLGIMTLCNGCFGILNHVSTELKEDAKLLGRVNRYLKEVNVTYKGTTTVRHLVHVLAQDVGFEKIKSEVHTPLSSLSVAQHIGCHVVRPRRTVRFDNPENPTILKQLIAATGAKCLDYLGENDCCGNPTSGVNSEIPLELAQEKLDRVKAVGAQALVTVCPFCHMMYDLNQARIERKFGREFRVPVFHYPQLLGLAMGMDPDELALKDLKVNVSELVSRL